MKRILFLIHDLSVGGAEKVLVNLVNNMDYTKFDVTVIALFGGGTNEKFLNRNVRFKYIFKKVFPANSKIMKIFSPSLLHKLFVKERYDCEISYLEGPSARIISGCRDKSVKLITWIHTVQQTKKKAAVSFRNYSESEKCYSKFDKVICVSENIKADFISLYPKTKGIEVLYNTNETEKILELKDEPVSSDVFKENTIKLCGVGRVISLKGFDKLAKIHKRLRDDGYPVYTYILGIGPETDKIKEFCTQNGIANSFVFLGYDTNPYKYVYKCDMFICSSAVEGFSTAATEALIVGTPVVTTLVSGMKEMLGENNEYGVIVENNEDALYSGIKNLLDNPDLLSHYKQKAKERGKFFSTENTVRAVENMLIEILNKGDTNEIN